MLEERHLDAVNPGEHAGGAAEAVAAGTAYAWPPRLVDRLAGYVLDGWGGIHPFGSAPSVASGG